MVTINFSMRLLTTVYLNVESKALLTIDSVSHALEKYTRITINIMSGQSKSSLTLLLPAEARDFVVPFFSFSSSSIVSRSMSVMSVLHRLCNSCTHTHTTVITSIKTSLVSVYINKKTQQQQQKIRTIDVRDLMNQSKRNCGACLTDVRSSS
jgi:hypothetical protein